MFTLQTPLSQFTPIGKTAAPHLKKLGLSTVEDLLFYFPRKYLDFSIITPIGKLKPDTETTASGRIEQISNRRSWRKKIMVTEAIISDDTGKAACIWFGQPYIGKMLKAGDEIMVSGKVSFGDYGMQFAGPAFEKRSNDPAHTGRLVPLYSLTGRLTQKQIRVLIKYALRSAGYLADFLPAEIKRNENLMPLNSALEQVHFPKDIKTLTLAQNRLKFDELFLIQLIHAKRKQNTAALQAPVVPFHEAEVKNFVQSLPFKLTDAQRKAAWQIIKDMEKPHPMNRLLEGDVGSGKTVVAAIALLNAALSGFQGALMAPTEILAKQHFETIYKILTPLGISAALLTHNWQKAGNEEADTKTIIAKIKNNEIKIVVGTHALIQEKIQFQNLALAVIDEQHRFGVKQRQKLRAKGGAKLNPHLLSMTATPIPRTLYLSLYGDLDLSVLDELPKGRQEIIDRIVAPNERPQILAAIDEEIEKGRQVFVLCPLIDESDKLGAKAATAEYEKLRRTVFAHRKIGLLHGRLDPEEKEKAMNDFAQRKINILVSTTVVEVGVDIPNASVMMIENAERFGLAQIWQLRGRVGRGTYQSYCYLFPETDSAESMRRLHAILTSKNGFDLAEKDLELRGPGEVYGTTQSGFVKDLRIATLLDWKIIEQAKSAAFALIQKDPSLVKYPLLAQKVETTEKKLHFE
ncbi:ATP-dependent DNA helicase RecG [Patescibacteria group bacterium]|nr:MAG: ATP-dependent DNA helicase RecG [Patescibacteria group bacterium]